MRHISYGATVLIGNIWLRLKQEPEPEKGTKVEPKINNFGSATLLKPFLKAHLKNIGSSLASCTDNLGGVDFYKPFLS